MTSKGGEMLRIVENDHGKKVGIFEFHIKLVLHYDQKIKLSCTSKKIAFAAHDL